MENIREIQIRNSEELLCKAMLESDTVALDKLLSSHLIFINHLGQVLGKKDDLDAHKSGVLHISNISVDEQQIKLQVDTAVVIAKVTICGNYDGHPANGTFRFTRVWQNIKDNHWEVIAAHSSVITA
ncbi:nuclear transport factor 2 family protein [Vibrio nitrifigilis]|uniref:Nuclear transport factor 2 family protein n=1 Tax=Vibrio nitrifigilis TaxID=2789781 RepID=A0ABS0GJV2_9VIBR|nr:nuclear transport factor 2 family protein [Vibrio nitrifigilis]MBF9002703.1 nuclear transport factor 2 family protein [Vibrio nitrifigilis]